MAKLVWKIVIIGDPAVGKTSIRRKYLGETTLKEYIYTIGADFATKRIKLSDDLIVQYQIFDLAGQQKFDKVRASFYSGAQAAILVYDITKNETLLNLPGWVKEAKKNSNGKLDTFVVVGNKIDLTNQKEIDESYLKKFLSDLSKECKQDVLHIETSALTGENIGHLFQKITVTLLKEAAKESEKIAELIKPLRKSAKSKSKDKTQELITAPIKTESTPELRRDLPMDKRVENLELEIHNIKLEIKEVQTDMQKTKDTLLKYLYDLKKIIEELELKE